MAEERTFTISSPGKTPGSSQTPAGASASSGRRSATTPKSQSGTARPMAAKADVEKAMAIMNTAYRLVADGLELFGLEETGAKWETASANLRKANADSLSSAPKLAKSIANIGESSGASAFFLAHVMAIATVVPAARRELESKAQDRVPRHAAEPADFDWESMGTVPEPDPSSWPGGYDPSVHIPGLN